MSSTRNSELFFVGIGVERISGLRKKANLTKVSDAKPRVLASYATFDATQDPQDRRAAQLPVVLNDKPAAEASLLKILLKKALVILAGLSVFSLNVVADELDCRGCIDRRDLAPSSVRSARITNEASGENSTVSGGFNNTASAADSHSP